MVWNVHDRLPRMSRAFLLDALFQFIACGNILILIIIVLHNLVQVLNLQIFSTVWQVIAKFWIHQDHCRLCHLWGRTQLEFNQNLRLMPHVQSETFHYTMVSFAQATWQKRMCTVFGSNFSNCADKNSFSFLSECHCCRIRELFLFVRPVYYSSPLQLHAWVMRIPTSFLQLPRGIHMCICCLCFQWRTSTSTRFRTGYFTNSSTTGSTCARGYFFRCFSQLQNVSEL
jgi:hypothetical protein